MNRSPTPRAVDEIGSNFSSADVWLVGDANEDIRTPPWATCAHTHYFQSGRQAIRVLGDQLRAAGRTHLVFPTHYCDSMLQPFTPLEWTILWSRVGLDFRQSPPEEHSDPNATVIFSVNFFGIPESPEWLDYLAAARAQGAVVICDDTHRVLEPPRETGDFRIGSLRKTLPVPDGAYLAGVIDPLRPATDEAVPRLRLEAMTLKAEQHRQGGAKRHLALFAKAEHLEDATTAPLEMSRHTRSLLDRLDYSAMAAAREKNRDTLLAHLDPRWRTGAPQAQMRSHFVIRTKHVTQVRAHLMQHEIYCPIHWPPPARPPHPPRWISECLSVPIDHRYSPADMQRVTDLLNDFIPTTDQESSC